MNILKKLKRLLKRLFRPKGIELRHGVIIKGDD